MPDARAPLVVRLRKFVGDVVLSLPALQRLHDAGYALTLVGKPWAVDLLAGHGWTVVPSPAGTWARTRQLRALRRDARAADPGFDRRLNAMAMPWSFGSALEMRLAGMACVGHAYDGRSALLARTIPLRRDDHFADEFWHLADLLLGPAPTPAPLPHLIPSTAHTQAAAQALQARCVQGRFVVIAPFTSGTLTQTKPSWRSFPHFASSMLPALGLPIVICPGPGEEALARRDYGQAIALEGLGLGAYAALLGKAALVIAGDTGPGHMAAAVGAPTLSLLDSVAPARWGVRGPRARILCHPPLGPTAEAVRDAAIEMLALGDRTHAQAA